jgi:hypothetical protein
MRCVDVVSLLQLIRVVFAWKASAFGMSRKVELNELLFPKDKNIKKKKKQRKKENIQKASAFR